MKVKQQNLGCLLMLTPPIAFVIVGVVSGHGREILELVGIGVMCVTITLMFCAGWTLWTS